MQAEWKPLENDECLNCGDALEALTECKQENYFYDGDEVRCLSKCGMTGSFSCDGEGDAWVSWNDGEQE